MRLIDADALLKQFEIRQEQQTNEYCDCFLNDAQELSTEWWCVEDAVTAAPTIDAVPVVHGRWEEDHMDYKCSACGASFHDDMFWIQGDCIAPKYCPAKKTCGIVPPVAIRLGFGLPGADFAPTAARRCLRRRKTMKDDLISRQSLMAHFATSQALVNDRDVLYCNGVLDVIERESAVDAVTVVRCKDCKLRGEPKECYMCFTEVEDIEGGRMCKFTDLTQDDGFCHRGAKMDGGANDADANV